MPAVSAVLLASVNSVNSVKIELLLLVSYRVLRLSSFLCTSTFSAFEMVY